MPKKIASKNNWIELGYKLFSQEGVKGLVVEKMALKLKVNKSSFYWHFNTKQDFINDIISYWTNIDTENIINEVESQVTALNKFEKLVALAFKKEPYLDFIFFLKRYAVSNKEIQDLVDEMDHHRIDFTKRILEEMGFSHDQALIKSQLFYKYLIGYHEMIRYKDQSKNYLIEVKSELNQFIEY